MAAIAHPYFEEKSNITLKTRCSAFLQIIGASALMALCSQIKITLPFTPIPLTIQTLAILLIGASLGSRKGALAVLLYYAQILIGLPVLSGGVSNPLIFFGPSGGYVLGWFFQAVVMGWFIERRFFSKLSSLFIGGLIAFMIQLGMGVWMLAQFVGWSQVWSLGLFPFLPGELLKVIALCAILSRKTESLLRH